MSEKLSEICDWCHQEVNIFEGITGFGKWYHEGCKIHHLQFEIEKYKKKDLIGELAEGDKADLADKQNLIQKLMSERGKSK